MKRIYESTQNGGVVSAGGKRIEATFVVNGTFDKYTIRVWPLTYQTKQQSGQINTERHPDGRTFALFHVHPEGTGPKPSTPGNNYDGNKLGDTGNADMHRYDCYVVSSRGLWMYSWRRKQSVQLRANMDWTLPCSRKPLLPPVWVAA
jgi:hypothetical protein